ncbi:MAG: DUF4440 domain-containing protein [Acidobacteriota bacterium]|nr:DUF4440 domain-containing protein [Acidobacteriota bacterium]MDH3525605.1 DUF4440 domain-containing protein [Acidobacteriota bacterium]
MPQRALAFVALSLPALLGAHGQEPAAERLAGVALPPALERVLTDYERAWKGGDEEELARLFVPDGFVPGRLGWLRGRDAIRDKYRDAGGDLRLRALAFSAGENVGFIIGAYGYGDEAATMDEGSFILALARESPAAPWLIVADLDRGNERPE